MNFCTNALTGKTIPKKLEFISISAFEENESIGRSLMYNPIGKLILNVQTHKAMVEASDPALFTKSTVEGKATQNHLIKSYSLGKS